MKIFLEAANKVYKKFDGEFMRKFFVAILIFCVIFNFGCGRENFHFERNEKVMGTIVTLKAEGKNSRKAIDESFEKIFALVEKIQTDVKNLNDNAGNGKFIKVTPEVFEILQTSQKYSELTGGAFDVTVGAAVDLWKLARKNKILPSPDEIENAKNFVGYQHLLLNEIEKTARLDKSGVKINLGGVGKGYGVDVAKKIFAENGIEDGIIDFGTSSIFAFAQKKIGLRNPRAANEIFKVVEIENSALSTSGDYEQFFVVEGRRYHHIINPKTCMPTENKISSATVIVSGDLENCGTVADILSTAIFILDKNSAQKIISSVGEEKIKIVSVETEY